MALKEYASDPRISPAGTEVVVAGRRVACVHHACAVETEPSLIAKTDNNIAWFRRCGDER